MSAYGNNSRKRGATSFPGSSPSRPLERERGREGEDPGNEVERAALLTDTFSSPRGCPLMRELTVSQNDINAHDNFNLKFGITGDHECKVSIRASKMG